MYKLVNYFIKYNNKLEQTKDFFFSLESPNKGIIDFNFEQQKNSLIKPCLQDGLLITQNIAIYEKDEEVIDIFANGVPYKLVNRIETSPQIDLSFELSNYGVTLLFSFEGNVLSKEYLNLYEILYTGLNSAIKNKFKKSNFSYDPYQLAVLNDKFHEEITKLWLYDINFYKLLFNDVEFNRTILRLRFNKLFNADYLITTDGNDVNLALDENVIIFKTNASGKLEITLNE